MNYIVFDLEWNQSPGGKKDEVETLPFEIIEIGAVKLNEKKQIVDHFHRLICPQVYQKLHHHIQRMLMRPIQEFQKGDPFPKAVADFLAWCGEDGVFCTWGSMDLTELQRNMKYFHIPLSFPRPLLYYDVQKLFAIACEDPKSRRTLAYAVDFLSIRNEGAFHGALSDAYYTADVLQHLETALIRNYYSIDCFVPPQNQKEEIYAVFGDYSKYISRIFPTKEKAMADREVTSTRCYLCGKPAKKKIRWFCSNNKQYFCQCFCEHHGYLKGKIHIKNDDDGHVFAIKILKLVSPEDARKIKEKQEELRKKRKLRRNHKKRRNNMAAIFDTKKRDSQGTIVSPVQPEDFDLDRYADYEASLLEGNKQFWEKESGLQVYRRVRADGVFYDKCRDYKESLALQLGALEKSLEFKADIANFLEPWYGIGYIAGCFGTDYDWPAGQAPSVQPPFQTAEEILKGDFKPIHETPIGKHILEMEEYFLDKTRGKLPISFCDIQAPLNMLSYLLPITNLFMEVYDDPDNLKKAAMLSADLLIEFLKKQEALLGDCLARPGHGFASSRAFKGAGMSDDNSIMIQAEDYQDLFQEADEKIGAAFGGCVYHSCGNWEAKIPMVKEFQGLTCVDGAFSAETDPDPNDPAVFGQAFAGSGIIVNTRAVGNLETSYESFEKMWKPRQKMIAVTYCEDPAEQAKLYDLLHQLAGDQ